MVFLIAIAQVDNHTVGSDEARVAGLDDIRTVHRVHILPCCLCVRAGQCRYFLVDGMGVGCRDAQVLDGLCIQLQAGGPSVAAMVVAEHVDSL